MSNWPLRFLGSRFCSRFGARRTAARPAAGILAVTAALLLVQPVGSVTQYEPMDIVLRHAAITAGDPLTCSVTTDGGPTTITIYSDPPGAVYYQGTVSGGTTFVDAATDPNTQPGYVTVYVQTDGAQVASGGVVFQ